VTAVAPSAALDFLLGTYLQPAFAGDYQLEIRGSIYHGLYSSRLLAAMKARFGRLFHFYAPDLTAQCAGMQVARDLVHVARPLELVWVGPSNGVAVSTKVASIQRTQEEAARGASTSSPPLIPGLSLSIAHLLACDLVAVSNRALRPEQWIELHRRALFNLYALDGWPDRSLFRGQIAAIRTSAARFGPALVRRLFVDELKARRNRVNARIAAHVRTRFGERAAALRRFLRPDRTRTRRTVEHLYEALDTTR
jgi:hypothetical protein